ncbi:MAG: divergent PAP2 family protein [Lachnospiraceae bacterium]|nr:divergent PAP2 family protein [Lachnospiraceae bacterium]
MYLSELLSNKIFISAVTGWLVAQVLKTLIHMAMTKSFQAERLVGSGGMPSSHSATVCALATSAGILYGLGSFEFAVTAIFAIVVMYDAMGVRRETGRQSKVLNEMIKMLSHMGKDVKVEDTLREFIGHTPLQVLAGAILGIALACVICL